MAGIATTSSGIGSKFHASQSGNAPNTIMPILPPRSSTDICLAAIRLLRTPPREEQRAATADDQANDPHQHDQPDRRAR